MKTATPRLPKAELCRRVFIAVAEKVVRLEVFGAECAVPARDIAWEWVGDAREKYHVGDRVMAVVYIRRIGCRDNECKNHCRYETSYEK